MANKHYPVKPARSFEEQAQRLTGLHDLEIENPDRARHIFSTVNYYRLTTYGKHLRRQDDPERFVTAFRWMICTICISSTWGCATRFCPCLSFLKCSCAPSSRIIWR